MAIGAEGILDCVWRFLHFSMRTSSLCVQKHPFVSAILLFFYILYVFFNIFMFWFPFLVGIAVLLKLFWTSGGLTILDVKQDGKEGKFSCKKLESVHENGVVSREGLSLIKQKSRRTNATRRINSAQSDHEEEKDRPISTASNYNLVGELSLIDKSKNKAETEKKNGSFGHGESSDAKALADANIQAMVEQHHSVLDSDISDSNLLSSDESEEHLEKFDSVTDRGPAQEDGTKAVQWTDDDQKNLMDLGLSEIERNKRLESLIARRRARKLFKMQVEKGLIDLDTIIPDQIAPIFVSRNPADFAKAPANAMDTPGSAPSILLPMQNPFDLPYDPQEEKPNLMADSFQQEFTAAHQKDMLFCRHESFSLGSMGASTFPSDTRRKSLDGLGYSRFKKQSETGEHDKHIERMLSGKHDDVIEALLSKVRHTDSDIDSGINHHDVTEKSKSSMGPREEDKDGETPRDGETPNVIDVKGTTKSVNTSEVQTEAHVTDDSNDEASSTSYSEEDDHHNNFNDRRLALGLGLLHNVGPKLRRVPPKPLSCSIPKSKTAREPLCDSSPRLEERLFYAGRAPCHTPTYSIASDLQVEVSEFGSPPMTIDGANSPTDRESLNLDGDFEKEYVWAASSLNSRMEECESKPQEPRGLSEKDLAGIRFSGNNQNTKDHGVDIYRDNQADMMSSGALSSNATQLESQYETMKLTKVSSDPSSETTKNLNVPTVNNTDNLKDEKKVTDKEGPDPQANVDTEQPTKDNKNSNHSEGDLRRVEYEGKNEHDAKTNFTAGVPEAEQISGDPVQSTEQKSIVNKDVLANSTASSSPKSVLLEHKRKDQVSSSNFNDEKHTDAAKSGQELEKAGEEASNQLSKQAEEIGNLSTKATEAASMLKVQAEEIEKVSQKATEAAEELKKPAEETRNVSGNVAETTSELKKSAEEIGSASQKAKEVGSEIKMQAYGIIKVSQKATEAAEELKKSSEEITNVSKNVTEPTVDFKKPAEEIGSGSQKEMEDAAKLKNPVKDASEKVSKVDVEFKKPAESIEVKKSAGEIGSGSQKVKEDVAQLKKLAHEVKDVSEMKKTAESIEVKKSAEEIGSGSQKEKKDVPQLKKLAQEVEDVSEMKKPADSVANVTHREIAGSGKAAVSAAEFLKSAEEIENASGIIERKLKQPAEGKENVMEKVADEKDRIQSKRVTEAAAELLKSAEDIGSPLLKATYDIADLKKPIEEIGTVSQQATKAGPESAAESKKPGGIFESIFENPTEISEMKKSKEDSVESKRPTGETGIPIEKATELKKPVAEIENVSQKATKPAVELKKSYEKVENDLGKSKETAAELKEVQQPAEEPGNVAQKATDAESETKKPDEAAVELKKPVEEIKT